MKKPKASAAMFFFKQMLDLIQVGVPQNPHMLHSISLEMHDISKVT